MSGGEGQWAQIDEAWDRISEWLCTHAPASYQTLSAPASSEELTWAEAHLKTSVDSGLRRFLSRLNGVDSTSPDRFTFPTTYAPLSVQEIVAQHATLTELLSEMGSSAPRRWWHPLWVPFATSVGADCLVLDHRPGPTQGHVGVFLHDGHADFGLAPSLASYLTNVATALEQGHKIDRRIPKVENGALRWRPGGQPPNFGGNPHLRG
jgi:cell wall assembly regulator SMI1